MKGRKFYTILLFILDSFHEIYIAILIIDMDLRSILFSHDVHIAAHGLF